VQVHDQQVERARAGQRVAVNLTGVQRDEVARGDLLTDSAELSATYLIDAALEIDAEYGDRVQVHHGTRETPARLASLGGRFWQLRLEQPLIPARGDRLVIRRISPPDTLGGGTVLDPHPRKHGPSRDLLARLSRLARGEPEPAPRQPPPPPEPTEPPAAPLSASALELERRLKHAGIEPPSDSGLDPGDLATLRAAKRAVRVSKSLHYHPDTLELVHDTAVRLANDHGGGFTLGQFRDALTTSR
jgi:selenocysteine-specific elongation factor